MSEGTSLGDCRVVRETDKALLVELEDTGEELWVPRSLIHDDSEVWAEGQTGELVVAAWWAEQSGLG